MKKVHLVVVFLLWFGLAHSQMDLNARITRKFSSRNGDYSITKLDTNIYHIVFQPKGYARNEHVSDAVILKKPSVVPGPFSARLVNDTIFFGAVPFLSGYSRGADFKGFRMQLAPDEMIFGGGERALPLNRRGYRLNLYNNPWYGYGEGADNLNYSVPFITSSKGYGLFFDNPSRGYLDIGKAAPDILEYGASSGEINVYVIIGGYRQILQSYHKLTGTQPLPPRWALGNLMSRFGYTSEAEVKGILSKMHKDDVPVDAVIFDLFWFGDSIKGTLGNLEWMNRTKWPDPKKMIDDFQKKGINTILVTEPFFIETSKNYTASKPFLAVDSSDKPYYLTDFYFGKGGLIDIFRKDSREWFWKFYKKQMEKGVAGWWGDLGEPEKHPSNVYHNLRELGYKRLFSADEVHNLYGHTWTKMLYNYYEKEYPNKRLFSLNRSGFAGSQRYSIFPWTGDVSRSWSGLRAQLPILLGMSMSGVPYVHSDAGGFAGGEGDNELYVRWLQFAAFTPIFRPHGTALYNVEPAAFSFPSEAALIEKPYSEWAKLAIALRYMLLPYNYSLAYQQTKYGKPLMAPLYYYFPSDTAVRTIQDEYMWGENILVAPVLEKGLKERKVYLPEGKWQDLSGKIFAGAQSINIPLVMDNIPVFVREGSFVPMSVTWMPQRFTPNTSKYDSTVVFLGYFPSAKPSVFEWFEDDGLSKNSLATGRYTKIICSGKEGTEKISVSIAPSNDLYLKENISISVSGLARMPRSVKVNGRAYSVKARFTNQWNLSSTLSHRDVAAWDEKEGSIQLTTRLKGVKKSVIEIIK